MLWKMFFLLSFFLQEEMVYSEPQEDISPSSLPLTGLEDYQSAFLKMLLSLLIFTALAGVSFWFLRKMVHKRKHLYPAKSLKILEQKILSPKSILYLVEVENRKVLITESQADMRTTLLPETSHQTVKELPLEEG